jgi:hypothetical protein
MRSFGLEVITGKHGHIPTGTDWDAWILETIGRARLAVALVSIKFFASRYITERELPWLLERAERNELKLSWILVRPAKFELPVAMKLKGMQSVWGSTQQCLPQKKGAARDKAWLQIAQELTKDA